ncbi:PKD domain-containing protein [Natronosalvus caseinilyticus]|uniref:PKD domain-containing protein n=1 Tax=Natronosalvus caseinilyticus TaxID=2953747 RepID=UPI0028A6271C|nr:succinylglutamate desuccinylase/aspartoacylase family protein [Natronosalvus caseinilyticus]
MDRGSISRRSLLTAAGSCALASAGVAYASRGTANEGSTAADGSAVSRDTFTILSGTDRETTGYVTQAEADGPTVVVLGGIHGNEVAGYTAAGKIADWEITAGTLVTIPEVNAAAIERGTRTDEEGTDLNRQFPEGEEPRTELARAIWNVLLKYEPDTLIDLHESVGIYTGDDVDGVGQAIFHSSDDEAAATAEEAAALVNQDYVDDADLAFQTDDFAGPDASPSGLVAHKAARELEIPAFLVETLSVDVGLETRVQWHLAIVESLVGDGLFAEDDDEGGEDDETDVEDPDVDEPEEPEPEPEPEPDDPDAGEPGRDPVAEIRTTPEDAAERTLSVDDTVELDASCSRAPEGEIVRYEWSVYDEGSFDKTGRTIDVTISGEGDHPIVLRVEDDGGRTDSAEITLSAESS